LVVVPVVYSVLDDFADWLHRTWAGKKTEASHAEN
jgi:hypothetical protein